MERERVRQFSIWQVELETSRDKEYRKRRRERSKLRKLRRLHTKRARFLFIPTTILVCLGIGMIAVSILPHMSKDAFFKRNAATFHIIGPSILASGVVLFMITEILVGRELKNKRRDEENVQLEYEDNKEAIRQEPYELVQYYKNTYEKAKIQNKPVLYQMLCGQLSVDSSNGNTELDPLLCQAMNKNNQPSVILPLPSREEETQTDDELLWIYLQQHVDLESSGQWKKKKVCKMESVESADYSMVSANTQCTDIDEVSDDLSEDEPLLRFTPAPSIVPSVPTADAISPLITVQFHSSQNNVTKQYPSTTDVDGQLAGAVVDVHYTQDPDEYQYYQNVRSQNRLGEQIPIGNPTSSPNSAGSARTSLDVPRSPINTSVPNLLLGLPPEIVAVSSQRRASWTIFY